VTLHDAAIFAGPEWFSPGFGLYYRLLIPLVGRVANKIITVSQFSRQEMVKYGMVRKLDNIEVIYNGLTPLREKRKGATKSLGQLQGKNYVLSLNSRDPRKNLSRLLAAWNKIPENIKNERVLALAGKADKVFSTEEIPTIPQGVLFLGYVPDDQLFDLYSGADAFVFPSIYEGFGLPPLEAMSCGTPVLVSNVSALPEICGNAAIYCDPFNVDDIAEKLERLLADKHSAIELTQRGLDRAKIFSWNKSAQELSDIFESLI
jgi:glycosyltransferase involved in cell wall biosynthesis